MVPVIALYKWNRSLSHVGKVHGVWRCSAYPFIPTMAHRTPLIHLLLLGHVVCICLHQVSPELPCPTTPLKDATTVHSWCSNIAGTTLC